MALHEGELFKEKVEVNLDGRQIFSLFCGGAVITSLVFVLGVTVGRRVEAREHGALGPGDTGTSDPLAALDQVAADDAATPEPELAFASTLRGEREGDPLGEVDRSLERSSERPSERPAERPSERPAPPAAPVHAEPPAPAKQALKPELVAAIPAKPATLPAPKPEAAKPEAPKPEAAKTEPVEGRFTLHLSSFQERPLADALVARLKKAGYQPYVVEQVEEGKGTWYRVRVGRFASFEDAVAGKTEFEKKMSIIAYVLRGKK
jgi:DedD protein